MQGQSFEEWFATLTGRQRDRYRRMDAELDMHGRDPDVRQRVRADMEQHHAPLAFETFFNWVHPGEWTLAARYQIQELLGRDTLAWQERYGPHIKPGTEAVGRIIANGSSYEDLAAFAFLVAAAKVQDVGFTLSHGEFFADLPGWRLMETWHGVLTGRALSIWGVYQAQLARGPGATARDGSPFQDVQLAWRDHVPLEPDSPADGTASIPIAPNPALTDRPLIGPGFWDAVRLASLEELKSRQSPGRGEPRTKTRVRRSELGEAELVGSHVALGLAANWRVRKAACPFHADSGALFYVHADGYHCFDCGAHGDAIGFVMCILSLSFGDAVTMLAAAAGMALPKC